MRHHKLLLSEHVSPRCSSPFLSWLSITQQLVGTELTENIQQMVCCCLCGRPLAAPPFSYQPSFFPCNPCSFHPYTTTHTHTHTHPPASLQPNEVTCCQAPSREHTQGHTNIKWNILWYMAHSRRSHIWSHYMHGFPLYSCYAPTHIKMARNYIDIHTYSLNLGHMHTLCCGDSLGNQARLSSLVSKSAHFQPLKCS